MEFKDLPSDIQVIAANALADVLKDFGTEMKSKPAKELARNVKAAFVELYSEEQTRKQENLSKPIFCPISEATSQLGSDKTSFSRNREGSKCEEWRIRIDEERFHFSRIVEGRLEEQFSPVNRAIAAIFFASIVQGFQPPRSLQRYDKQSD
ncbi:hypothetical protein SM021_004016 [Cronobacter muytjensii]|nr:hypothetical protein [Cronobacter muytjensii]